ncbi:MAG: hypothetical protein JW982_08900 [Spirochaetes bacterium]|nr:hypothetical protein [Spirochaetota bacterium]
MKKLLLLPFILFYLGCALTNTDNNACTGNCKNGTGKYTWKNGSYYTGEWKDGKRSGNGIFYYSNGSIYDGQWENDKRNGTGTLKVYENKKLIGKYTGKWVDDEMHGEIILYDENNVFLQKLQYFHGKNIGSSDK